MKELSFDVSQFPFNEIKCETAAIRQGAVVVAMRQLEIILSVQATGMSVLWLAAAAGSLGYLSDPALLFPLLAGRHLQLT